MNRTFLVAPALLFPLCSFARADIVEVHQQGFDFFPQEVTVSLGDTVRFIWHNGDHTVTEGTDGTLDGSEAFHSLLTATVPVFDVVFDQAMLTNFPRPGNRYDYQCLPHVFLGMDGVVTVVEGPGTSFCSCDGSGTAPPCSNAGQAGRGCANSISSLGARLISEGNDSVGADDLAFHADSLLFSQPALLFSGNNAINGGNGVTFGDGLRCAGQNVRRLGVAVPDSLGRAQWGPGLGAGGGWSSGDTRNFQGWYRDPQFSPCGSGFNLTNGVAVTFTP
ncbi:MAG: plastocyanin/azurin family copper-binding protein [Planctomycetota bacterium]|jgi:plastocyanin|nr:plastocyanin/azurin family copper-binding protein [Planctomycetota bacterium]MDP6761697.1 plastocyanin/azurin family copper-binding protein [Planctomycetota bacterium]MDP6990189.1 plastocyanin/azurin family copper-binding protein [Planctomycetota bacterium]